jgi:hypothetical protein
VSRNLVQETSTSTGTANFDLAGATTGHFAFGARYSSGATVFYVARGKNGSGAYDGQVEVGVGNLNGSNQIVRLSVSDSSNSDDFVSFSSTSLVISDVASVEAVNALISAFALPAADVTTTPGVAKVPKSLASGYIDDLWLGPTPGGSIRTFDDNEWGFPSTSLTPLSEIATSLSAEEVEFLPFTAYDDIVITDAMIDVTTNGGVGAEASIGIYEAVRTGAGAYAIGDLIENFGTVSVSSNGLKTITGLSRALARGTSYAFALSTTATMIMRKGTYNAPAMRIRRNASNSSYAMRINKLFGSAPGGTLPATAPSLTANTTATTIFAILFGPRFKWTP